MRAPDTCFGPALTAVGFLEDAQAEAGELDNWLLQAAAAGAELAELTTVGRFPPCHLEYRRLTLLRADAKRDWQRAAYERSQQQPQQPQPPPPPPLQSTRQPRQQAQPPTPPPAAAATGGEGGGGAGGGSSGDEGAGGVAPEALQQRFQQAELALRNERQRLCRIAAAHYPECFTDGRFGEGEGGLGVSLTDFSGGSAGVVEPNRELKDYSLVRKLGSSNHDVWLARFGAEEVVLKEYRGVGSSAKQLRHLRREVRAHGAVCAHCCIHCPLPCPVMLLMPFGRTCCYGCIE